MFLGMHIEFWVLWLFVGCLIAANMTGDPEFREGMGRGLCWFVAFLMLFLWPIFMLLGVNSKMEP